MQKGETLAWKSLLLLLLPLRDPHFLQFDNERVYAPVDRRSRGNSVAVGNVGIYMVVETDFGLVVKYDGNQHLEISLPSTYFSQVSRPIPEASLAPRAGSGRAQLPSSAALV